MRTAAPACARGCASWRACTKWRPVADAPEGGAILITECLQNDFVAPISKHDPLPNLLHVGYEEARRLLGENPREGPVARAMAWAAEQEGLAVIHIRDWHDGA